MSTHLALLAHWLATVSCVRSLLPWCPDHPSPPRQTGRVTRSPQLYLAVGALVHHHFFVRNVMACVNVWDCDGTQAHEVGTHNSFWLLRNRDFTKCLTCVGQRTIYCVCSRALFFGASGLRDTFVHFTAKATQKQHKRIHVKI